MIRAKHMNFLLLAIFLYSFLPRFCTAQGNTNTTSNTCETYGKCGPFGSCNSQDSPICTCLRGFYPRNNQDWSSGNWTSGCVRRVPLNCEGNNGTDNRSGEDGFLKLQKIKISGYSARWSGPEDQCQGRCLGNCSCIAYGFDVGIGCMFWSGTLIDIQIFPSGSGSDLYIRVANSELGNFLAGRSFVIFKNVILEAVIYFLSFSDLLVLLYRVVLLTFLHITFVLSSKCPFIRIYDGKKDCLWGSKSYVPWLYGGCSVAADRKKDNKKTIIIVVVVGLIILSICTYFSWKWMAKRRGNMWTINPFN